MRALVDAVVTGAIRATHELGATSITAPILDHLCNLDGSRLSRLIHDVVDSAIADAYQRFNARARVINRLPNETWCHIWSLLDLPDRLVVTGVCRAWRVLAIETPHVWNRIQLITDRHGRSCGCDECEDAEATAWTPRHSNIGTLPLAFQRGRNADIDLVIDARTNTDLSTDDWDLLDQKSLKTLTALMHEHGSRVVSITLNTDEPEYYGAIMQRWGKSMVFSQLHTIHLIHIPNPWFEQPHFQSVSGDRLFQTPRLRRYEAFSGVFDWPAHSIEDESQTRYITDLSVGAAIPWLDIPSILNICPALRRARIFASHVELVGQPTHFIAPGTYPHLQSFILDNVPAFLEPEVAGLEVEPFYDLVWEALLFPPAEVFRINYADVDGLATPRRGLALFRSLRAESSIVLAIANPNPGVFCLSAKPLSPLPDRLDADGVLVGATRIMTCQINLKIAMQVLNALETYLNLDAVQSVWIQMGSDLDWLFPCIVLHMPRLPAATALDVRADGLLSVEPLIKAATEAKWDERLLDLKRLTLHTRFFFGEFKNWTAGRQEFPPPPFFTIEDIPVLI